MAFAIQILKASSARVTAALKPSDRHRFPVRLTLGMPMATAQPDRGDRLYALNTGVPSSESASVIPSARLADLSRNPAEPFPPTYRSGRWVRAAIVPVLSNTAVIQSGGIFC